jgi:hypothetical protein
MTIAQHAQKYGFKPDPQNPKMSVTRYVRPFDYIGFAVMYEHETGFLYGVEFKNDDELIEYMNGGFILSPTRSTGFFVDAIRYRPRIEFLSAINRQRIDTIKQFDAAFSLAEHVVECSVLNIEHRFKIGERVLIVSDLFCDINPPIPATVTRYDLDGVHIHVFSQRHTGRVLPEMLKKLSDHILTA